MLKYNGGWTVKLLTWEEHPVNASTKAVVEDICDGLVDNAKLFSAFEVALIASDDRGCATPRKQMKEVVHEYFNAGGLGNEYSRTWQSDPQQGAAVEYYVYHPKNEDPRSYEPLDRNAGPELKLVSRVAKAVQPNAAQPNAAGVLGDPIADGEEDEDEDEDGNVRQVVTSAITDRWGRIRLRSSVLSEAGITKASDICLGIDTLGNSLVITKRPLNPQDSPSGQFSGLYKCRVDRYCNVRIGSNRFVEAGIQIKSGDSVTVITENSDRIVISI